MRKYVIIFTFFIYDVYAAMVVHDPASMQQRAQTSIWEKAQRYKEQVEFTNQTVQLTKTVATLEAQLLELQAQVEAMTANFQRAAGFENLVEALVEDFKVTYGFANLRDYKTGKKLDTTKAEDVSILVDQLFAPEKTANRFNYNRVKAAYKQRAYKGALESAELVINNAPDRAKEIGREVMRLNAANQVNDSVNINGRLIAEMLLEQQKTNMLLAQLVRVASAQELHGIITDAKVGTETRQERVRYNTYSDEKIEDFILPSGKRGYDPFKKAERNKALRRNNKSEDSYNPFE